MSVFPTDKQLASWAGQCPGTDQSAGSRRSGKTRNGSRWLDRALEQSAMAAIRTNDSYLAAQYARLKPRRGHKKASARSSTRSSSPAGTCSPPARCTSISAATTSANATPSASPMSQRRYFPSSAHTADAWTERSCCSRAPVGAAIFSDVVTERRPSAVAAAHCTYPGKLPVWP